MNLSKIRDIKVNRHLLSFGIGIGDGLIVAIIGLIFSVNLVVIASAALLTALFSQRMAAKAVREDANEETIRS